MKKIGVAIIGCGYWGPNLIRNFQRLDAAELRWICDKESARLEHVAKDLHLKVSLTTKHSDLLQDPDVDAVGRNSLVGAGSVVVKNVPENSVVAGNPARVIKSIDDLVCSGGFFSKPYEWPPFSENKR